MWLLNTEKDTVSHKKSWKKAQEMQLVLDNEIKEMEFKGTVQDLLKDLKVRREEVVVKVNGSITPETREIGPDDKVEVIQVVFGG